MSLFIVLCGVRCAEFLVNLQALVTAVRNHLMEKGRLRRERRPFRDIMLMVVWLLATPDTFRSVALRFGVTPGTLYYFYAYTIEAMTEMSSQYIIWPDAEERIIIREAFAEVTGFPGCVGCIDCTHVFITAPIRQAQAYVNRHHCHSINVQAVVDNNLLVRSLHVGEVGSMNDKRVFSRSELYEDLLTGAPGDFLDEEEHLVGEGAHTLTDFVSVHLLKMYLCGAVEHKYYLLSVVTDDDTSHQQWSSD